MDTSWIANAVRSELAEQEKAFYQRYETASDDELLDYLRRCAQELGGTPYLNDIVGADLFKARFGKKWERVLAMAGIPKKSICTRACKGDLYSRQLRRLEWCVDRANRILAAQEEDFVKRYAESSKEQLLDYVRKCAGELGFSPLSGDIVGGQYIAKLFSGWSNALSAAGLSKPQRGGGPEAGLLFVMELERRKKEYDEILRRLVAGEIDDWSIIASKAAQKEKRRRDALEQKARDYAKKALIFKEQLFAVEYAKASDKLLLKYLSECAKELGRLPYQDEVVGGEYIATRFGDWQSACEAINWHGAQDERPEPEKRLIYVREVKIQKFLLQGQEMAITTLYNSPLIERMQAGNIYHILRWSPHAKHGVDKMSYKLAKDSLKRQYPSYGGTIVKNKELLALEMQRQGKAYNKTLEVLDVQNRRFVSEYRNSSDQELLAYIKKCAREISRTPHVFDLIGGAYIRRRLNADWNDILKKAKMKPSVLSCTVNKGQVFKKELDRQLKLLERQERDGGDINEAV